MQYQGGKSRIANNIKEVVLDEISRWKEQNFSFDCINNRERERERVSNGTLVSLFCGTCSVESKLSPFFNKVICNDINEYLVEMLKGVQSGYGLPESISEEEYQYIKNHKDEDKVLTGFVAFGCSFGGKFFGGYARNKTNTNYALQSKKSLLKDMTTLETAEFTCKDYREVVIPKGSVVYCDPPYDNTTPYSSIEKFNSQEFWEYMRKISQDNLVFISEQNAPDDFECIWEKPFTRTLDRNKDNQFKVTEKLFKWKG